MSSLPRMLHHALQPKLSSLRVAGADMRLPVMRIRRDTQQDLGWALGALIVSDMDAYFPEQYFVSVIS